MEDHPFTYHIIQIYPWAQKATKKAIKKCTRTNKFKQVKESSQQVNSRRSGQLGIMVVV